MSIRNRDLIEGIEIAAKRLGRDFRSVLDHYRDIMCRIDFSQDDDAFIINRYDSGISFKKISKYFPGSTPTMIRIEYKRAKRELSKQNEEPIAIVSNSPKTDWQDLFEDFTFNDFQPFENWI